VDEGHGVISHVQASVLLPSIVAPLHHSLLAQDLPLREIAADTNYSNELNDVLFEAQGITPCIPAFGQYNSEI
jgi:hypothetical protein